MQLAFLTRTNVVPPLPHNRIIMKTINELKTDSI